MMSYGRRSIRKKGYDYSRPGWYFVTICTHKRQPLFSSINNSQAVLSPIGNIASNIWAKISLHFHDVHLDAVVFMPDHMHAIVNIGEQSNTSLSIIIQNYKSISARKISAFTKSKVKQIWQRNYYEHIIRNERALNLIRLYIELNPRMKEEHLELRNLENLTEQKINEILSPYRDQRSSTFEN